MTTEGARGLYPESPQLTVWVGRLQAATLPDFLHTYRIAAILDASHPFAVEISQLAIAVAAQAQIPYLRFERPPVKERRAETENPDPMGAIPVPEVTFPTFQALLDTNLLVGQRALLTVGYRPLSLFQPWQEKATLFARILPSETALQAAITAGFTPDRLIALRPPVSAPLELALWQHWHISTVVTKASGTAGGEDVKRQVAADLGIRLITIVRPDLVYPQQTDDPAIAVAFCHQYLRCWSK